MSVFKTAMFSNVSLSIRARFLSVARKLSSLTIVLVSCLWSQLAFGSALSDLARSMQPGTWAPLATNGFNDGAVMRPPNGGSVLEFTDKSGLWNPVNGTILLLGASHPNSGPGIQCDSTRFASYRESTNTWANNLPNPCPTFDTTNLYGGSVHAYHHETIVPSTGDYYHRQYYSRRLMKFSHATQSWSMCTDLGNTNRQVAGALEYFPDRNSLIFVDGDWGVWELSLAGGNCTGVWQQLASTNGGGFSPQLTGLGAYHNQSRYSPRCQCVIFGGGQNSRKLYRYSSNGAAPVPITDSPVALNIPQASGGTIFTIDPVTGYLLLWHYSNAATTIYQYDPADNTWSTISRTSPIFPGPEGGVTETIAVPISTYGVILFVQAGSTSGGSVYLYRHASGFTSRTPPTSDTAAPSVPSTVSAVAASSSQINLSWAPSTDNIGVQGYKIYRSGAQIGIATSTVYSDSNLSPATSYSYTVAAYDAAGNTSAQSGAATATTQSAISPPPTTGSSDFQTRCSQSGVIKCVAFDSVADITGSWGINPQGVLPKSSGINPVIDSNIKASGTGSMKMTIPAGSPGGVVGDFFANFSNDYSVQFGENSEFYVQWRIRIDDNYFYATQGKVGMKNAIIGTGSRPGKPFASCTDQEIVVQNNSARGFPQMYHSCSGAPINYEPIFDDRYGAYDFKLQNARPSPYCLYSQGQTTPKTFFPPSGNCFAYFANEWVTLQVHIKLGPRQQIGNYWYFANSTVELWLGREGRPSELAISAPGRNLEATDALDKYGQIWLLPYSGSDIYPNGGTIWYDELIISRSKVPDPNSVATPGVQPPAAPTGLTLK